jgi:cytochrome c553
MYRSGSRGLEMTFADFIAGANLGHCDPELLLFSVTSFFRFLPERATAGHFLKVGAKSIMSPIEPKGARVRLDEASYEALRLQVLRRDSWRCQSCGSLSNLEVHHQRFRSQSGQDVEQNLITLCAPCHAAEHRWLQRRRYPQFVSMRLCRAISIEFRLAQTPTNFPASIYSIWSGRR